MEFNTTTTVNTRVWVTVVQSLKERKEKKSDYSLATAKFNFLDGSDDFLNLLKFVDFFTIFYLITP